MLPKAGIFQKFLLIIGQRKIVRVEGNSMLPTLKDGDIVSVNSNAKPAKNIIVLANHPYKQSVKIIKRISKIDENGNCFLLGDNPTESTDSRTFGVISPKNVLGIIEKKLN